MTLPNAWLHCEMDVGGEVYILAHKIHAVVNYGGSASTLCFEGGTALVRGAPADLVAKVDAIVDVLNEYDDTKDRELYRGDA